MSHSCEVQNDDTCTDGEWGWCDEGPSRSLEEMFNDARMKAALIRAERSLRSEGHDVEQLYKQAGENISHWQNHVPTPEEKAENDRAWVNFILHGGPD